MLGQGDWGYGWTCLGERERGSWGMRTGVCCLGVVDSRRNLWMISMCGRECAGAAGATDPWCGILWQQPGLGPGERGIPRDTVGRSGWLASGGVLSLAKRREGESG